ncbi:MAG: IS21 family transposase [Acidimicrobiales bacterium]
MEVLEAFDLTNCYRTAAELTGVDHHTVAALVAARAAGTLGAAPPPRPSVADTFADNIDQWVDKSSGKVRADVVHDRLVAMGYSGSPRTTRRVVAHAKGAWKRRTHRVYKPWITEPGHWLQWDYGDGPMVSGLSTILFCAWLAWSRFRVIIPLADRSWPSVVAALDQTFRIIGGAPTYLLTDNEKTVTDHHIAGIPVRNRGAVDLSRYYGVTIATCVPYDPESKGGSERTVGIAKADLVPTDYNLLEDYADFSELRRSCAAVADSFNHRVHAVTRQIPAEALEVERGFLHAVPDAPYSVAFGESRSVGWSSVVSFRGARYSVPDTFVDTQVWVRVHEREVVIVSGEGSAAREVARHDLLGAGGASILDTHYRDRSEDPLRRQPKAKKPSEAAFLALGEGAGLYLSEAAACGARKIETRMAEAVTLASLHGRSAVDAALGIAAMAGRFGVGDLGSILVHSAGGASGALVPPPEHSLAQGTQMWSALGLPSTLLSDEDEEGDK